jgi:hypothetical protein
MDVILPDLGAIEDALVEAYADADKKVEGIPVKKTPVNVKEFVEKKLASGKGAILNALVDLRPVPSHEGGDSFGFIFEISVLTRDLRAQEAHTSVYSVLRTIILNLHRRFITVDNEEYEMLVTRAYYVTNRDNQLWEYVVRVQLDPTLLVTEPG